MLKLFTSSAIHIFCWFISCQPALLFVSTVFTILVMPGNSGKQDQSTYFVHRILCINFRRHQRLTLTWPQAIFSGKCSELDPNLIRAGFLSNPRDSSRLYRPSLYRHHLFPPCSTGYHRPHRRTHWLLLSSLRCHCFFSFFFCPFLWRLAGRNVHRLVPNHPRDRGPASLWKISLGILLVRWSMEEGEGKHGRVHSVLAGTSDIMDKPDSSCGSRGCWPGGYYHLQSRPPSSLCLLLSSSERNEAWGWITCTLLLFIISLFFSPQSVYLSLIYLLSSSFAPHTLTTSMTDLLSKV